MAWLEGFSNRIKLTIPPDNVDNSLTDFPVLISLSSTSGKNNFNTTAVFDELSYANRKRIAITTNDGITQCPVEIEYWDNTEEKASLWTKIPTVYSSVDTDLYFYYDATYSGTTISGNTDFIGDINDMSFEMVLDYNTEETYDTTHVYAPCVIKESDTSYKMWYSGNNGPEWRILYAVSADGIAWTGHQMVLNIGAEGIYDTTNAFAPCVIKESDTSYKMWYSGHNGSGWRILYTDSTNGITWSNHQLVLSLGAEGTYDTTGAYTPTVIKESDTSYKMWYSGYDNSNYRILYATSTNGTTWTGHQMVLNIGAEGTYDTVDVFTPSVIKESDTSYKMWYTGYDETNYRILYATSTNGTTWGSFKMVVDLGSEGTYDATGAKYPCVVEYGENRLMYYSGDDSSNYRIIRSTYWKTPAQDVWDDNFVGVWHMSQDPSGGSGCILDSTSNVNHGTPNGSMTSGDLVDGKIGKAVDFNGSDASVTVGYIFSANHSISMWIKPGSFSNNSLFGRAAVYGYMRVYSAQILGETDVNTDYITFNNTVTPFVLDTWSHLVITQDNSKNWLLYVNGQHVATDTTSNANLTITYFGRGYSTNFFDGLIDEVCISNTARSAAWVKATYYSNIDNFIVFQEEEITTNWLTDWAKRIKLIIDNTNINSTLIDFPLAVTLVSGTNTGVVFDELVSVSGTKKITITESDGISQCYIEIERWDWNASEANLWTKVPVVHNDEDTILYLYYDSTKPDNDTYVGDTGDAAAKAVWDSNFVGVWHMSQDPSGGVDAILDSTSNLNHGTSDGSMTTGDLVDYAPGKGIDLDGIDDEIQLSKYSGSDVTVEAIVRIDDPYRCNIWLQAADDLNVDFWLGTGSANQPVFGLRDPGTQEIINATPISSGKYHFVGAYDASNIKLFVDLSKSSISKTISPPDTGTNKIGIWNGNTDFGGWADMLITEARLSNVVRSDAWIKATYYSNWNDLVTYDSEQQRPIFLFYGYVKVSGIPAARTVHLYRRATGDLIESVVSNSSTGYFEIGSYHNDYHFVVVLPELTEGYNLIAYDQIDPGV